MKAPHHPTVAALRILLALAVFAIYCAARALWIRCRSG